MKRSSARHGLLLLLSCSGTACGLGGLGGNDFDDPAPGIPVGSRISLGFWTDGPEIEGVREMRGITGVAENDVWAVGKEGAFHFDGARWSKSSSEELTGVWAGSADQIIAVGWNKILRWNGSSWDKQDVDGLLEAVWGSASDDVWAVGLDTLQHFDGTSWTEDSVSDIGGVSLHSVSGSARDNVWAVGDGGQVLHFDGSSWAEVDSGTGRSFYSVATAGPDRVWILTQSTVSNSRIQAPDLVVLENGAFARYETPFTAHGAAYAFGPDDVRLTEGRAPGFEWDGEEWRAARGVANVSGFAVGMWGPSPNLLYAITEGGELLIYRAEYPRDWALQDYSADQPLFGVSGSAANDVWAVGAGGLILHYDGNTWTQAPSPVSTDLKAVAMAPDGRSGWAVGGDAVLRYADGVWSMPVAGPAGPFHDVDIAPNGEVWLAGDDPGFCFARFDGTSWTSFPSPTRYCALSSISAASGAVYAGTTGSLYHWLNGAWVEERATIRGTMDEILAVGPDDVWAAGYEGLRAHYDGTSWTTEPTSETDQTFLQLSSIARAPDGQIYAAGLSEQMVRHDGAGWKSLHTSRLLNASDIYGLWISPDARLFAVGKHGGIVTGPLSSLRTRD